MHRICTMAVGLCLWIAAEGFAQQEFRWKFRAGDTWNVDMTQEIVYESGGNRAATTQGLALRWRTKEVREDGTAAIEQSVRRLKMVSDDKILIDTDDPEPQENDPPTMARLRALLRVRFTAETTARGEIIDVQFEPEVLDRLRDQLGLTEDVVRQTFAQESLLFPARPLQVGATWTSTTRSSMQDLGNIRTTTTYQYVGDENVDGQKLSKFKLTPSFQLEDATRALVKQDGSSTLWFDSQRGRLYRSVSKQEFEIRRKDAAPDQTQKTITTTTVQFSDGNP